MTHTPKERLNVSNSAPGRASGNLQPSLSGLPRSGRV